MEKSVTCPNCGSNDIQFLKKRQKYICEDCSYEFIAEQKFIRKRIFLSYGRDEYSSLAEKLCSDLKMRGHDIWFDQEHIQSPDDWEIKIEEGLKWVADNPINNRFLLLLTPHSVRRPDGYCLNELSWALSHRVSVIPLMVVWCESPLSICRIQYIDIQDCLPVEEKEDKYSEKLQQIIKAVEEETPISDGVQYRLMSILDPLPFDAEITEYSAQFTGRTWLINKIDAWINNNTASRVFWIMGRPGIGKTAIVAHLCAKRREVGAVHLCRFGIVQKSDPARCVLSIAYQLSTQLPDYQNLLNRIALEDAVKKLNAASLFDLLITQPLAKIPKPEHTILIVIDALDEATKTDGENELAKFLAEQFPFTPNWLKLIITSRPDPEVIRVLQGYIPYDLDDESISNEDDVRTYLKSELGPISKDDKNLEDAINIIVERSEGLFLYVCFIQKGIKEGQYSLDRLDELPRGMNQSYLRFFERQFPRHSQELYNHLVRPALELIAASRDPLHGQLISQILGWSEYDHQEFIESVGSLFIETDGAFRPFHLSLMGWLTNASLAGSRFMVSLVPGNERLAAYGWDQFKKHGCRKLPEYFILHLPFHMKNSAQEYDPGEVLRLYNEYSTMGQNAFSSGEMRKADRYHTNGYNLIQYLCSKDEQNYQYSALIITTLNALGETNNFLGNLNKARTYYERALKIINNGPFKSWHSKTSWNLADLERRAGNYHRSHFLYDEAEKTADFSVQEGTSDRMRGNALRGQADLERRFGHSRVARDLYEKAISALEIAEDPSGLANALVGLGDLERCVGNTDEAVHLYDKTVRLFKLANDNRGLAHGYGREGIINSHLGRYVEARNYFLKAQESYKKAGFKLGLPLTISSIAFVEFHLGDYESCRVHLIKAEELCSAQKYQNGLADIYKLMGDLATQEGQWDDAMHLYLKANKMLREIEYNEGIATTLLELGNVSLATSRIEESIGYINEAKDIFLHDENALGNLQVSMCLGNVNFEQGKYEEAKKLYLEAEEGFKHIKYCLGRAKTAEKLGDVYERQGMFNESRSYYETALELYEFMKMNHLYRTVKNKLG
ncbi:MAG: tetratricopeptide repeat protein [Syntrophomonas sp.]